MRKMTLGLVVALGVATGCSTVKSGLSALGGGKPHQVTVVNNIEPAQPIVIVQQAPAVVAQAEPVIVETTPTPLAQLPAPKKKSRLGQLKAAASGAVAGALVGTAVGYAIDGSDGAAKGAALGAGAGAVGGAVAHRAK
jgi:hypothetical protein